MEKLIETIHCADDRGNRVTVLLYQEYVNAATKDDPYGKIPGMQRMTLENGRAVNYIDDYTFKTLDDRILKRL